MKSFKLSLSLLLLFTTIIQPMKRKGGTQNEPEAKKQKIVVRHQHNQQTVQQGLIAFFPLEIIQIILTCKKECKYPWQEIARLFKLKTVCKAFHKAISDDKIIAAWLGIPPLHFAAATGNKDKIIELKLAGHSLLETDARGWRPSYYAVGNGQIESMKILKIGYALIFNHFDRGNLVVYASDKDQNILEYLSNPLRFQTLTAEDVRHAQKDLMQAIENNQIDKVSTILELATGAIINQSHLTKAQELKHKNIEKLLLYSKQGYLENRLIKHNLVVFENPPQEFWTDFKNFKANPNALGTSGYSLLHLSLIYFSVPTTIAEQLLKIPEININIQRKHDGLTPLHVALRNSKIQGVKLLLEHGANIKMLSKNGSNCLHFANSIECLEEILKQETELDVNAINNFGITPLHLAAFDNHLEKQKKLLRLQANPKITARFGTTPLHWAVFRGNVEAVRTLLDHGAQVNAALNKDATYKSKNYGLYTPLHVACEHGHVEVVKLLLECYPDLTLKTQAGRTALELAQENGHDEIIELLK